jgi:hypothetical protein
MSHSDDPLLNMQQWAALLRAHDDDHSGNYSLSELLPVVQALEEHLGLAQDASSEAGLKVELEYMFLHAVQVLQTIARCRWYNIHTAL